MTRVYMDSNVFSNMKNKNHEKYEILNGELDKFKNNIAFVFSPAHIRDKTNDITDKKFDDFDFMKDFVIDNYISYHSVEKNSTFYLATPLEVFQDNDALESVDFVMNSLGGSYRELRKAISKIGEEMPIIVNNIGYERNELFNDDKVTEKFVSLVKGTLYHKDKSKIPFYDFYLQAYSMLDILGYSKDELSKKNSYNNIFNDSLHSYYARYCDYLVTEDEGLKRKSRILYNRCENSTSIVTVEEFIKLVGQVGKNTENNMSDVFRNLAQDLISGEILEERQDGDDFIFIIKPEAKYFNFFDIIVVIKSLSEGIYVFIKKSQIHYLSTPNYRECEMITNRMVEILGDDFSPASKFDFDIEVEEMRNNQWKGRYWDFGDTRIHLQESKASKEFCIQVGPLTQWPMLERFTK